MTFEDQLRNTFQAQLADLDARKPELHPQPIERAEPTPTDTQPTRDRTPLAAPSPGRASIERSSWRQRPVLRAVAALMMLGGIVGGGLWIAQRSADPIVEVAVTESDALSDFAASSGEGTDSGTDDRSSEDSTSDDDSIAQAAANSDPANNEPVLAPSVDPAGKPSVFAGDRRPQVAARDGALVYVIQAGDVLSSIAWAYGVLPEQILQANPWLNPSVLYIGDELLIPQSTQPAAGAALFHVIEPGENLSEIAKRYDVAIESLLAANPGVDPNALLVGQELLIPPPMPVPQQAVERPATPPDPNDAELIYFVEPGDTFGQIASQFNVSIESLLAANPGIDPNALLIGQELIIAQAVPARPDTAPNTQPPTEPPPRDTSSIRPAETPPIERGPELCVTGIDDGDVLNFRSGPGTEFKILHELEPGQCGLYAVNDAGIRNEGDWVELTVPTYYDSVGFVSARYIGGLPPAQPDVVEPNPTPPPRPAANGARVRFIMIYGQTAPGEVNRPINLSQFEVRLPNLTLGRLDNGGNFPFAPDEIPAEIYVSAEYPDDPFCWWSGSTFVSGPGTVTVQLETLCA